MNVLLVTILLFACVNIHIFTLIIHFFTRSNVIMQLRSDSLKDPLVVCIMPSSFSGLFFIKNLIFPHFIIQSNVND